MKTETIEARGFQPLLNVLQALGGWPLLEGEAWKSEKFSWFSLVWRFRQLGYSVDYLLDFSVTADLKNSSWRVLDLDQPTLGISREYLVAGLQHIEVAAYLSYMVDIATMLGADRQQAAVAPRQASAATATATTTPAGGASTVTCMPCQEAEPPRCPGHQRSPRPS